MAQPASHRLTPELALAICRRLEEGESLRSICSDPEMPPRRTVREWVREDRDGFAARYHRARELGWEDQAERIIEIADAADRTTVEVARLRIDARKWVLAKALPKIYGDRVQLAGDADQPLVVQIVRFGEDGQREGGRR